MISFNRDYEPFARKRDQEVLQILKQQSVEVLTERDHLIIEPHELVKEDGSSYQVYSPYARKWYETFSKSEVRGRVESQKKAFQYLNSKKIDEKIFDLSWSQVTKQKAVDALKNFQDLNNKKVNIPIPAAGPRAAMDMLSQFKSKIENYSADRDFPAIEGTSRFSMFLKNGSLTSSQILFFLKLDATQFKSDSSANKFLKEIVWREFYYSILWHHPRVENEAFIEKYKNIKWENSKELFQAWCEGQTGYPIVDAGMRQLNQTGWMHNRVRMIVASFLVKDLLIDWRWGENYFMKKLLDGDLAPNNGGWQWAASTGCDPQPYFRIFNPLLQSQKFDPEGDYIRTYVPELANLDSKRIHQPVNVKGYPKPIVDHFEQKPKALALFKV
jgi:deoxyribodipyrimidine photo-lyase